MRPCNDCHKNKWKFYFINESKVVRATCINCGLIVEFKPKHKKQIDNSKIEAIASYSFKDGKRYLEINKNIVEVGLYDFGKFMKICPVDNFKIKGKIGKRVL